jgi:hypothetical protein
MESIMPRASTKTPKPSLYSVHPGVAMMQKWVAELKEKTGRTKPEWIAFIQKEGPTEEKARREWLKKEHGIGSNSAWWLAEAASGGDPGLADEDAEHYLAAAPIYVDAMYAGAKAALRPIYDQLLSVGLAIGPDAKACPCKTIVPLYRNHVFAQLKPTTSTRIDLGLSLGDHKPEGRLIDTGGFQKKDRITHRIPIAALEEIDEEVKHWLKIAYDRDA